MATLMEGPPLAGRIRAEVAEEVRDLGGLKLVTVQVGDDPGSTIYLRRKHEAAQEAGIESDDRKLPDEISEEDLLALVAEMDADEDVDGILVQLPLPEQIDEARVIRAIDPVKEGFDCALQIFPPHSEELVSKKLFPVRRVFCASPEYVKRHGRDARRDGANPKSPAASSAAKAAKAMT